MAAVLRLARDLALPVSAVTEPIGIFANRGKGKSNAGHLVVEQLFHVGLPAVVLDVKGDWFGIRSSSNGRGPGLPFLIFGGDHGDVPLEPGSGGTIARFVAEQRIPCIIDLSHLSKTKARQWVMEFAETLYRVNRQPLMVVVDEADVLIPQRLDNSMMRLLGAMEDIAKRGRQRGLGILVISQRVADVNKSVTDLLESLLLFAVTGVRTRKAILEWIDDHADPQQAKDVVATLSTLDPGECWVWSPGWLKLLKRVRLNRIETFDSHATPEPGKTRVVPRTMADIDLAGLTEEIQATVERAKADDPKELRRRIAELEKQLATERAKPAPEPVEIRVEVPVLAPEIVDQIEAALSPAAALLGEAQETLAKHRMWAEQQLYGESTTEHRGGRYPRVAVSSSTPISFDMPTSVTPMPRPKKATPAPTGRPLPNHIPGAQQKLLDSLAWFASVGINPVDRTQLALFAGVSPKSSGYANNLGALRTAGLIDYPAGGVIALTGDGHQVAAPAVHISSTEELQAALLSRLPGAQVRILEPLILEYPDAVEREVLAGRAGVSPSSSGYANNLGALRSLGLIDYPQRGWVAATSVLFLEGR